MSIRLDLGTRLAADWKNIPALKPVTVKVTERTLDDIQKPTALLRMAGIGRAPAAPMSHRNVGILLTLISPHVNLDAAADQLDDLVEAALDYLDKLWPHDDATVVTYGKRLAYDIPLTVLAPKE